MSDKRTAELGTMDVSVAYVDGLIVVDSLTLQSVDGEQQKVLLATLLEYFRNRGEDFYIGALNLQRIATTNNNTVDVMLLDSSGNVRIRNIGDLIQGSELIETEMIKVTNENYESPTGEADNQAILNQQLTEYISDLQEQIDDITSLGAAGTIETDPVPHQVTTTETIVPFSIVFDSTNSNVIEFDETTNTVYLKAIGLYQNNVFIKVSNADASTTHTLTLRMRNFITDAIIEEVEIPIYKDGYTGTWINRFSVTNINTQVYYTAESTDATDLLIEASQINLLSFASGVPESFNPYIVNVFGLDDDTVDAANIQQALSVLEENQTLALFGVFDLRSQIDFDSLINNVIDCSCAFLKFYRTDSDPICFNLIDSSNIKFIDVKGSFEHSASTTNAWIFYLDTTATENNILLENINVPLIGGTVTTYYLVSTVSGVSEVIINNVFGDYGVIDVTEDCIVENVFLTDASSKIIADEACKILKCFVGEIEVTTDNNNIVTNNFATTYTGVGGSNIFNNNVGQVISGGLEPDDDVEITGNWYFSANVGFGGISSPSEAVEIGGNLLLNAVAPYIDLYNSAGAVDLKYWRIINNSAKLIFRNLTDAQATDQNVLTLNASNGYVGIGESSPSYKLHIEDSAHEIIRCYRTGAVETSGLGISFGSSYRSTICRIGPASSAYDNFAIQDSSNNTKILCNLTDGYFGINTNTPAYSFHCVGYGYFSGNLYAAGNVGIGTTSPSEKFHVVGTGYIQGNYLRIGTTGVCYLYLSRNGLNYISADTENGAIVFQTGGGNERMRITSDGSVGIGTGTPSYKLHVAGTGLFSLGGIFQGLQTTTSSSTVLINEYGLIGNRTALHICNTSGDIIFTSGGDVGESSAQVMRIRTSGRVGINTSSPSYTLDVNGICNISDELYVLSRVAIGHDQPSYELEVYGDTYLGNDCYFAIGSADKVGIGTSSPSYDFEINKDVTYFHGAVGIGTEPSYQFDVFGDAYFSGDLLTGLGTSSAVVANLGKFNGYGVFVSRSEFYLTNGNASGVISFCISGAHGANEKMRLTSTGRLGIGITSPSYNLHVAGTGYFSGNIYTNTNIGIGTTTLTERFTCVGALAANGRFYSTGNIQSSIASVAALAFWYDSSSEYGIIACRDWAGGVFKNLNLSVQNVGISVSSPSYKLHVGGQGYFTGQITVSTYAGFVIRDSVGDFAFTTNTAGSGVIAVKTSNSLRFRTNDTEQMRINANGNVGIGTDTPNSKLSVVGDGYVSTALMVGRTSQTGDTFAVDGDSYFYGGVQVEGNCIVYGNGVYTGNLEVDLRLGVATSSPAYELDVNGDGRFVGTIIGGYFAGDNTSEPVTRATGGILFIESGALKYKGSSGTVTTLASA